MGDNTGFDINIKDKVAELIAKGFDNASIIQTLSDQGTTNPPSKVTINNWKKEPAFQDRIYTIRALLQDSPQDTYQTAIQKVTAAVTNSEKWAIEFTLENPSIFNQNKQFSLDKYLNSTNTQLMKMLIEKQCNITNLLCELKRLDVQSSSPQDNPAATTAIMADNRQSDPAIQDNVISPL